MVEITRLHSLKEAAQILNVSVSRLRTIIYAGRIETFRLCSRGKVQISEVELERFIKANSSFRDVSKKNDAVSA